ncbi:unnamed protein product [Moneuplotes crassus]|uniref:Uncharacterized protein n=1 Tax=Euplotes crassus TaxID=5936 RepID=A0AAD1U579_EUPCR|nr:unnamed protein product [Moneuplotes crassus]
MKGQRRKDRIVLFSDTSETTSNLTKKTSSKGDILSGIISPVALKKLNRSYRNNSNHSKTSSRNSPLNRVLGRLSQKSKSNSRDTKYTLFKNLQTSLKFFHSRKLKFLGEA